MTSPGSLAGGSVDEPCAGTRVAIAVVGVVGPWPGHLSDERLIPLDSRATNALGELRSLLQYDLSMQRSGALCYAWPGVSATFTRCNNDHFRRAEPLPM